MKRKLKIAIVALGLVLLIVWVSSLFITPFLAPHHGTAWPWFINFAPLALFAILLILATAVVVAFPLLWAVLSWLWNTATGIAEDLKWV